MTNDYYFFENTKDGLILTGYRANYDFDSDGSTEITLPAEHDGQPIIEIGKDAFTSAWGLSKITISEGVRRIGDYGFAHCKNLRAVSLPASLEEIRKCAFHYCGELREVEFKSSPSLGESVFRYDFKLPAELILAGQISSLELARPIPKERLEKELRLACELEDYLPWFSHSGAFALAAKNDSFREISAELLDEFTEYTVREKMPEITAYLLELKKRKFGFEGGSGLDL